MTDKEMLELAAKAAGIECHSDGIYWTANELGDYWRPLKDDGDALRLAVKLGMLISTVGDDGSKSFAATTVNKVKTCLVDHEDDPYAATRRAIVRAAAEIGKAA